MKRISRYGAYGILLEGSNILLIQQKSGLYQGLWGLPGGGIEFGETPEDAFKRELLEEAALTAGQLELFSITTATGEYKNKDTLYKFHQIGIIYKVIDWEKKPDLIAEDEWRWMILSEIRSEKLTPFAESIISKISLMKRND
ncbi:MAG: NUDIX hydrolase [Chlamydiales bacterium]